MGYPSVCCIVRAFASPDFVYSEASSSMKRSPLPYIRSRCIPVCAILVLSPIMKAAYDGGIVVFDAISTYRFRR